MTATTPAIAATTSTALQAHKVLGGFKASSDLAACLLPLLRSLGWRGDPRHIAEALPHFADMLDLTGLRNVMAHLGYSSRPERLSLGEIDPRLAPCLFLPDNGAALVVLEVNGPEIVVFNGELGDNVAVTDPAIRGIAFFFNTMEPEDGPQQNRIGWFRLLMDRFRPLFWQAFIVTFLLNLLSLGTPLFTMAIYDKVIATGSLPMLYYLLGGVAIALVADALLRSVRSRVLAFIGARLDNIVGNAIFERILSLPPGFTERATIGAQVARIKDFESVREFFTGPLAVVFMELPFTIFYFFVIGMLGGWVAVIPILTLLAFVGLGMVMLPIVRRSVAVAARSGSRRQEFVVETISKMRALKLSGADRIWLDRYRDLSAKAAMNSFKTGHISNLVSTLSHMLIVTSGLSTIALGVSLVLNNSMSIGGLIASMMLVWRVLSPIQTGFMTITKLEQVRSSIRQIDNLMGLRPERDPRAMIAPIKSIKGRVVFSRVSLRYSNDADPALIGVSFEAKPGEVIAVVGRNGSGKSTILKLIAGLYSPQAGSVRIDNMDIRQLDPIELRHAIAYVPQVCNLFHGTIAQNLRLAHPTATDEDLRWACEMADVQREIDALPEGLGTRVGDGRSDQLPASLTQKLSLVRAYLKRAPITLFDEPVNGLDFEGDKAFMAAIERMRGQSTIFIVTHRPSHLRMADKILVLDGGYLRLAGPAEEVRPRIPGDML